MGGCLMQLVAYGSQDAYLTGDPHITFFKTIYRRHTNFAVDSVDQTFNGAVNFNRTGTATLSRHGDLVSKIFVRAVLPTVEFNGGGGNFAKLGHVSFAWTKNIGHALIDEIKLDIGGTEIDKQYGDWLHIWQEVSESSGHQGALDKMLGNLPELTSLTTLDWAEPDNFVLKPSRTLYIPLMFYFCRNNGLALPMIALQYHEVKVQIKFRPADQLYVASEAFKSSNPSINLDDVSLYVDYISLDTQERRRFAQHAHEYLIEQIQSSNAESIGNSNSAKYKINFNHPIKGLYFVTKLGNYQGGKFMVYDDGDWKRALKEAARLLLLSQFDLDDYGHFNPVTESDGGCYPSETGTLYDVVDPSDPDEQPKYSFNDNNSYEHFDGSRFIGVLSNKSPLLSRKSGDTDLRNKVDGIVRIYVDDNGDSHPRVEKITRNNLTIADLSIPVDKFEKDNRAKFVKDYDVYVWQHHNYGLYIDGKVNPVSNVELKLNGHPRQQKRNGAWHDTVVPYSSHSRTPQDGLNCFIFALKIEDHQPSCTCNFSRIDTAELNLWFDDFSNSKMSDVFANNNNTVTIYAINYNVLRIMSGMAGLAYSN